MKRSHVRRLLTVVQGSVAAGSIAALIHCGGGTNPPAADSETPDAGHTTASSSGGTDGGGIVTFPDIDPNVGIVFGDSGMTDCGKQAAAKTFTMKNTTSSVLNYTASLVLGSDTYTLDKPNGGIQPNSTATITISSKQIPAESDVTPDLYAGTIEIDFLGNGIPQQLKLHQTARGAIVSISGGSTGQNGASFDLGSVKVGTSNPIPVSFSNAGNQDVTASLTLGSTIFTIGGAQTTSLDLQPNTPQSTPLAFAPTSAGAETDTLTIAYPASAVFCKAPITTATITGTGTTSVGITPSTLDFGQVNCGTTADSQSLLISSTIAMTFTPVFTKGGLSAYTLTDSTGTPVAGGNPIQLAAASTYTLKVVPKKIDPVSSTADNGFGDTLTITTSVPGDTPHVVNLLETAKGAVLKFDQSSVTVTGPVGQNINTTYNLINSGNAQVPYAITLTPAATFTSNLSTGNAIIGSTPGVLISKAPTASGSIVNGSLGVVLGAGGGILCADLPPNVPLQVTGTGSAITINPASLNFGSNDCNDPSTPVANQLIAAPQSFSLSSTVSTNIKLSLGLGPSSPYTLARDSANATPITLNSSVPVSPGSPFTVWVIPKAITAPATTATNGFGDTLSLTSDIAAEAVRTVALSETAHGAIYTFPGQVQAQKTASTSFTVTNSGNATGSFTVNTGSTGTTPNTGALLGAGAATSYTVPAGSGGGSFTVSPDKTLDGNGHPIYPVCGNNFNVTVSPPPPS